MQANTGHGQNNSNQGGQGSQNQKPGLSWSQPQVPATSAPKASAPLAVPAPKVVAKSEQSYTGTYVGIFVGGIIVGALIGWAITNTKNAGPSTSTNATSTITGGTVASSTASNGLGDITPGVFTISSPQQAGFAVAVSNVLVTSPTWVVIYEDHNGTPGNALGAELFLPQSQGTAQNGTVQLLRGTLPSLQYYAGQALDDGDKIFSFQNDKPVRDTQGNPVLVQFSTK